MSLILPHLELSATVAPILAARSTDLSGALALLRKAGGRMAQLSVAVPGIRPRELSRQARQELLGLISRRGLMLGGLELMIPARDWLDSAKVDQATLSTLAAIELAADLGRVPLSIALPVAKTPADVKAALLTAADGRSVLLAVHHEEAADDLLAWLSAENQPMLKAALDPAAALSQGHAPHKLAARLAPHLGIARLDDFASATAVDEGGRCPVGDGDLLTDLYRITLSTIQGLRGVIADLRGLQDPLAGWQAAADAWGVDPTR